MNKKVMIVANGFGFIYKFKVELITKLKELDYEVVLVAKNENEDIFLEKLLKLDVKIISLNMDRRKINLFLEIKLLYDYFKIIKKNNPIHIYTYTIKPNIYIGILSLFYKINFSPTITGLGSAYHNKSLKQLLNFMYKIAFKRSKGIFFENSSNLKVFLDNKIVNKNKAILLAGSGVNLNKFYPMRKNDNRNLKKILFLGRIMKEKGIEEYLSAAQEIKKSNNQVEFLILGSYEEEVYKKKIQELEKEEIVKYLGVTNDVRQIIKEIDILIQPSYHEGLSNVILEASAMEKLVLASNINGCKEAIFNKKHLFEVKNPQSLLRCLEKNLNFLEEDIINQKNYIIKNFNREKVIYENIKILGENENYEISNC